MAQVSISPLNFLNDDDDGVIEHQNAVVEDVDSSPYWPITFGDFTVYASPDLSNFPRHRSQISSVSTRRNGFALNGDISQREDQVNFVMDMFHQRVEQSQSSSRVVLDPDVEDGFGVIEGDEFTGLNNLDVEFGLGLGLGLGFREDTDDSGFHVEDCDGPEEFVSGLRVVDVESDSDHDGNCVVGGRLFDVGEGDDDDEDENIRDNESDDPSLRLCWGSFQLEDHRDVNEDFEWEEIDGRVDEREILSLFDEEISEIAAREDRARELENLEWEFLLNVQNLEPDPEFRNAEFDLNPHIDQEDYNYTAEYELLFEQFAEAESALSGRPPASKIVVRDLPTVAVSKDDLEKNHATCAICKDEMNLGEEARQLPCAHRYHGDCILPWLGIRNTCPVCRYELPTDDPVYERGRRMQTQRVG
ncbi:E3 ubiquitin ligase BIG BROTHER-related [Capsicum galapagoense]